MRIELDDLDDLCLGMSFLGTGGGGNSYIGRLLLAEELKARHRPRIMELEEVPDDWLVAFCVTMGSPSVLLEKFPNVTATRAALRHLEKRLGRSVDALVLGEAGGINGTLPLAISAQCGIPVINADGMGRAFPELPMVTFNFLGCSASPLVLADDFEQMVLLDCISNSEAERLARQMVTAMGAAAQLVAYPMSGTDVKRTAIPGALSFALQIGRIINQARAARENPLAMLVERLPLVRPDRVVKLVHEGKIIDLSRQTAGSFAVGQMTIAPSHASSSEMVVEFQNESYWRDVQTEQWPWCLISSWCSTRRPPSRSRPKH